LPSEHTASEQRFRPAWDAALALADGTIFRGRGFGAKVDSEGEVVFTTAMCGYQEICTDPSLAGQIVCMTYPLIGNYGVNAADAESRQPWIAGLIIRELCDLPSNWRSEGTLDDYLRENGIGGIEGIDTRALTRHLRAKGEIRGVIVRNVDGVSDEELIERAKAAKLPGEWDVVGLVSNDAVQHFGAGDGPHVVIMDCGVKQNIIQSLVDRGAVVSVVPYGTPLADIEALKPDGILVSPGPGDPANLDEGVDVVRSILGTDLPFLGICLGHQLLARAIGADTAKLKFGHRGGNHPVKNLQTGTVSITSQNHSFYVDGATIPANSGWEVALVNLNDRSVEGLRHTQRPIMTVQFHPEASPGPWDSGSLFDEFLDMVRAGKTA